ncbi:response regulator [Sinorhizobium medicae]|uniref:DNA-binding response regulator n=1 Tax=Sinorhizobium medicae TaxID=110321 RepID=A0ABX4TDA4_9HYPH|nr:response regulator transcription factor [Sinorhizobium medicae]PLT94964.1 DNA-binding response regulator [Sinorhizobium medicae]PLU11602.1 DNA-binding response regulator [Sinorhizobium medicae]PLU75820.1 DNA-binding response regulator [Sinorhizobium medicae]
MYSVVLADDHPLLLGGLQQMLIAAPDFSVVGVAANGRDALCFIHDIEPDIAVLDMAMAPMSGLDVLRELGNERLRPKVIFLTATMTGAQIASALSMGAWGILLKEYAPEALLDCLRHVAGGEKWLPEEVVARAKMSPRLDAFEKFDLLTPREREITALVSGGLSNRTIAQKLGASEGTIGIHLHNIFRKLEITNRTTLAGLHLQHKVMHDG